MSYIKLKYKLDKIFSILVLPLLLPFLFIVSLLIILSDGFPIFHYGKRAGLANKSFTCYKFRTLKLNSKTPINKITIFFRKANIDELPQLLNIIKGDMSLIGPRPHDVDEDIFFDQNIKNYYLRKSVKPGMTGLAAVNGNRGGAELSIITKRLEYDLNYINNLSLTLDIKIFFKTIYISIFPNH